jgi:DNA-binding NarL/FixJ family response regulator
MGIYFILGLDPLVGCLNPKTGPLLEPMQTSLYEFVLTRLSGSGLTYQEIADGSGVSKRTIEKIARKEIADPGVSHIEKLAAFFRLQEAA